MPDETNPPKPQNAASPNPQRGDNSPWTPLTIICFGLAVILASMAAAFLTVYMLDQAREVLQEQEKALKPGAEYLAAAPATLLLLIGVATLTIGTLRWALYGHDGRGAGVAVLDTQHKQLGEITNRLMISETAKKVAYRVEDIRLLRETIEQDIARKEFDAALVLVKILADTYGRIEESEAYRERIEAARHEQLENRVGHEVARLDEMLNRNDFPRASRHASRIKRLFPTIDSVQEIDQLVRDAKDQHKHDLERQFLDAARNEDVAGAMALLKELDRYLSPLEAKQFEEVARGVIGKQRDNLGVQFKLAVHDKEWLSAVRVGEQIVREFPNTRMADEVRGMLDLLRERAAGQQAAAATA